MRKHLALRHWIASIVLLSAPLLPPSIAFAQSDPAGQREMFRQQMQQIADEARDIGNEIQHGNLKFCTTAERLEVNARVTNLRTQSQNLSSNYRGTRAAIVKQATANVVLGPQLSAGPEDPSSNLFWQTDETALRGMNGAVTQLLAEYRKTTVRDCTPQTRTAVQPPLQQPPATQWPAVPQTNPLDGIMRTEITEWPLPIIPVFCKEDDRFAFYNNTFRPLYDDVFRSSDLALGYRAELSRRHLTIIQNIYEMRNLAKPGTINPNELNEKIRERDILQREIDAWEPIALKANALFKSFDDFGTKILAEKISDCTPPAAGPRTTTGVRATGTAPRTGTPAGGVRDNGRTAPNDGRPRIGGPGGADIRVGPNGEPIIDPRYRDEPRRGDAPPPDSGSGPLGRGGFGDP